MRQEPASFPGQEHSLKGGRADPAGPYPDNKALGDAVQRARDTPLDQRPVATQPPAEPRPQSATQEPVRPARQESRLVVRDGMRPADLARRQTAFDRASDDAGVARRQLTESEQHRLADREAAARATEVERAHQANAARNQALWRAQERDRLQTQRQHWSTISESDLAAHFQARREQLGHGTTPVDAERLLGFRADVLARIEGRLTRLDAPAHPAVPREVVRRPVDEAAVARAQQANIARNEQAWREQERARLEAQRQHLESVSNDVLAAHFQARREQLGYGTGPVDPDRLARFRADALARVERRLVRLDAPPPPPVVHPVVIARPTGAAEAEALRAQQANIARNEQVWREQERAHLEARREHLSSASNEDLAAHFQARREQLGYGAEPVDADRLARFRADALARVEDRLVRLDAPAQPVARRVVVHRPVDEAAATRAQRANIARNEQVWREQDAARAAAYRAEVDALSPGLDDGLAITVRDNTIVVHGAGVRPQAVPVRSDRRTTIVVDPSVTSTAAVRRFIDGLPADRTRALTVEYPPPRRPITAAAATDLATRLLGGLDGRGALVLPAGAVTGRAPQDESLVPVDGDNRVTFAEVAERYYVHPAGRPAPRRTPLDLPPGERPGTYWLADGWEVAQTPAGLHIRPPGSGQPVIPAGVAGHQGPRIVIGEPDLELPPAVRTQVGRLLQRLPQRPDLRIVEHGPDPYLVPLAAGLPAGYQLTAVPRGVVLHRDGTAPAADTVAQAARHAVPAGLTVLVDPSVTDLRVVDRYLRGLPVQPDRLVSVVLPSPDRPYPPRRAIRVAGWLGDATKAPVRVLYPVEAINERPEPGGRLLPVTARGTATFPELARHVTVLPDDAPPIAPHNLEPADQPGTYQLVPGWVVEQTPHGLWVRPAALDGSMPAFAADGPRVVVGGPGATLNSAGLVELSRALAPLLPPGVRPEWHVEVTGPPAPALPPDVHMRQTATGVVLYQGAAPDPSALDLLPPRPRAGQLVVVLDRSVTDPARLRPVLDALRSDDHPRLVVHRAGPLDGADLPGLAGALLGGLGVLSVPADGVGEPPPGTVPVDSLGRVTFPALAHAYQVRPAATPYGLEPAGQPGTYRLRDGWVVGGTGAQVWARPAGFAGTGPASQPGGRPRIVIGAPGIEVPPTVLRAIANIAAGAGDPEVVAPSRNPIGPQARHRPLPEGVRAVPGVDGLYALPSAAGQQAGTRAVLNAYAAGGDLPDQVAHPATMLAVDGPVDPATRTVQTAAGPLSPAQLIGLLVALPHGAPDTVVFTHPGSRVAGPGGVSLADLLAATAPVSVIAPAGEVELTEDWRLSAAADGWYQHRGLGTRPLGPVLAYPAPWDGTTAPVPEKDPVPATPEKAAEKTPAEPVAPAPPVRDDGTDSEDGSETTDSEVASIMLDIDDAVESEVDGTEPTSLASDGGAKRLAEVAGWSGWQATPAKDGLTEPALRALESLGLHGLADEPGVSLFTKVAVSGGYLGDLPMRELAAAPVQAWTMAVRDLTRHDKEQAGADWPVLGLTGVKAETVTAVDGWLDGGLDPALAPAVLLKGLPPETAGIEVLLRLLATLVGRRIRLIRADGESVEYGTAGDAPVVTLVQDKYGVLGTVPYEAVPALLVPTGGSQLVRPVVSATPTALADDGLTFGDLPGFLAAISGAPEVTLPEQAELPRRLREAAQPQGAEVTPGPGLAATLERVRTAIATQARPVPAAEPAQWGTPAIDLGDPNALTEFQAGYLTRLGRAAVWNPAGPNAFFAALVRAGEHDQHRLLGLAGWSPAELRWMFGGLLQADLAAAGNAWPLLGADPAQLAGYHDELLDWVAQVATPGAEAPEHLPEALSRTVAELFGVRVVLVEPHQALPEIAPSTGDPATLPVLYLVVDADGHTMATVTSAGKPGTVVQPLAASGKPPVGERPPASEHIPLVEFNRPAKKGRPSGPPVPSKPVWSLPPPFAGIRGKGGPSGPPLGPGPGPRPLVNLNPLVYPMGIPKATLPYLQAMVEQFREYADQHRLRVTEDELTALPQRLLSNYRAVSSGSGLVVQLGRVEVLFHLNLSRPRLAHNPGASVDHYVSADSVDDDVTRPAVGNARFRANQSTQGTFQTGAHGQTSSGQAGAFRARVSLTAALGLDPAVVQVAKLGFSVSGIANKVDRSTSHVKDAETGHVEDTRDDSTLLELEADWSFRVRRDPRQTWEQVTRRQVDVRGVPTESLFLWVPRHYLGKPGDLAVATAPAVPKTGATPGQLAAQRAFLNRLTRIPDTFFASNLTGLPELYDRVVARLTEAGVKAKPGGLLRNQLMQALWNLDTHLDTAINDPRGYRFTLGRRGQPVAEVTVHTERSRVSPTRVGAASNLAHLEKVRTAISGHSSGFTLGQESSFQLTGEVDLVPVPGLSLGPQAYAAWTYNNSDGLSAGRNGLWVLVSRYSGFTSAYDIGLSHRATVTVRNRPNFRSRPTAAVAGRALLRVPEPEAFAHGFPVDKAAFKTHPGVANNVAFTGDALRGTGIEIPAANVTLPAHVLNGHGVGQALVKVDRHIVDDLLAEAIPPLQRHGFLPADLDHPFQSRAGGAKLRKAGARSSKLDNLELLYKMISGEALDTHYNDIHVADNGMSFTLRRRSGGTVTSARVTVTADQVLRRDTVGPNNNSIYFQRRTGDYHVVNLAMGLDIAGQSAGGGQKFTAGLKAGLGFTALPHLRTFTMGVEYDRSIGATESATTITNTPQLMEYPGDVDEFRLPSHYTVTIDFEDEAIPQVVSPQLTAQATVHLLPHFNMHVPPRGQARPSTRGTTPREVLDQAVVYYLDSSGVLAAARRQEPELTRPGRAADQEVVNFTSNISMTAHLKEIMHGQYATDALFEPGIFRDELVGLSISGDMRGSEFAGATPDQYTLGLIKLALTQAGQTASRSHGVTWNQLDVAGGSDVASPHLASAAGEMASAHRWGRSESRGLRQTGGKEFLELNFQRAYAFRTLVDFDVQGVHEKRAKVVRNRKVTQLPETVRGREMVYLLSEPDALEQYAEGRVPLPASQLDDVFRRWRAGTTPFSASILSRVLARWERDAVAGAGPDLYQKTRGIWAERLARQHSTGAVPIRDPAAREELRRTFGVPLTRPAAVPVPLVASGSKASGSKATGGTAPLVPPTGPAPATGAPRTFIPPYLTRRGPKAVGHAGFHKLSYHGTTKTTFDLVYEAVQQAAPGLLGQRQQDWQPTGRQVWWSLAGPGEPVIGRLQGGLDALQAMLSGGREQALIEDLLSGNGMRFYLVNPMGWLLSDVVELTVRMELRSTPEIVDFIPDNGLENYLHGYTEISRSRGRDSTQAYTVAKAGLGGTHGTSGGPEVHLGGGQHRSSKQADENIVEQTVYDWTGHYRARVQHRLVIDVRRVKMAGRGINNQLATWVRTRSGNVGPVHREHDGELILKIPRGLAEAAPLFGPAPAPSFTPLPALPADSLVSAVLLDDALPIAQHMMRVAFGESANTAEYRSSLSLPMLLSRSHLGGHLLKALGGNKHTLANDLFVPGHSSDRAKLSMSGELYDMQIIARVDNTGTGRYAKYLSTTSANVANDRWNTSVVGGVDQGGTTEVLDPQNADKPWAHNAADSSTGAARQAPPGIAGGGANNPRREQHIKQQGQVYLVKVRGRFFLELERFRHEVSGDPEPLGAITSEPITGDVFLEVFADEIEEMRRDLDAYHLTARAVKPVAWERVEITRTENLDERLVRAALAGANAWEAPIDVANQLREARTEQQPLRLTTDAGVRAYQIHEAIAEWEIASLRADHRAIANLRQAELDAAGPALRAEATTQANGLEALAKRTNKIIERVSKARRAGAGPRRLPSVVPVLSIDPVHTARQIAHELHTYVELVERSPGEQPARYRIDLLGRVFRVRANGTPYTVDEAVDLLPQDLQLRLRADGLGRAALIDLYENSWIRQQSFEQAVRAALGPPPTLVRPPTKSTKPDPSLPPPKDPPTKLPVFGSPTFGSPTFGSPASESTLEAPTWGPPTHGLPPFEVPKSKQFAPPKFAPPEVVPPEVVLSDGVLSDGVLSDGVLSGIGSVTVVPAPPAPQDALKAPTKDALAAPTKDLPAVPPKDALAQPPKDALAQQPPAPVGASGGDKSATAPVDDSTRAALLTHALGEDGYVLLLEDAAGILRRMALGVADGQVLAERLPDLADLAEADGTDLTAAREMELVVGMDRLLDVAEARIVGAARAEAIARQVGRDRGVADDEVQPLAYVDLNRPLANQVQPLRDLGRYAAWTAPDGDCWFGSVINAARDRTDQTGIIGELALMSPAELRDRLATLLDGDPEVLRPIRNAAPSDEEYRGFREELATPTRWGNDLFDVFFQYAPRLLGIRVVVVNVDGNPVAYGRADAPTLYLVRTGNHYMPALRSPGAAYLAYHWLAGNQPGPAATLADLAGREGERARQLHAMSETVLAQVVRRELVVPGLVTEAPAATLPRHLPRGTRIWMATPDGRARAAWRTPDGVFHTFDPHSETVGQIPAQALTQWVGAEPHTFVVARPATVPRPPDTRTTVPARGGSRGGRSAPQPTGRHGWMPSTSSTTGATTEEATGSGAVGGSTLTTTLLPPARLAPQPVSATVSAATAPAVSEDPALPAPSRVGGDLTASRTSGNLTASRTSGDPAASRTSGDLAAPSVVVVQAQLSSPRESATGSTLADHLRTLSGASRRSAAPAPDPRRLVEDWLAAEDWPASMEFFAAYRTALHTAPTRDALRQLAEAGAGGGRAAILAALLDERFAGHGDIGYRYLIAATPDEGLDVVLPELVEQPELIEAMAALIEAVDAGAHRQDYHAVMLRATALALAGRGEDAVRLVRGVRGRIPGKPKLAWVDRLRNVGGQDQAATVAVGQVREELMLCGIPSKA